MTTAGNGGGFFLTQKGEKLYVEIFLKISHFSYFIFVNCSNEVKNEIIELEQLLAAVGQVM